MANTKTVEELTADPPEFAPAHESAEISDQPTLEEIAREAYAIYMANGARHGCDLDDWLEAERRLAARRSRWSS